MSKKKIGLMDYLYTFVVPRVTSLAAAVVIVGALFKIMHWPGAGTMLTIGLLTEAAIFAVYAAQPLHYENQAPDWTRLFPQLNDPNAKGLDLGEMFGKLPAASNRPQQDEGTITKIAALEKALADKVNPGNIDALGKGMKDLSTNVEKMAKLGDASVATNEYSKNVKLASNAIVEMNKSYQATVSSMQAMAKSAEGIKNTQTQYQSGLQSVAQHLGQLNSIYETEVKNTEKNVKAMGAYFQQLSVAMNNVSEASKGTEQFKNEMASLTTNLTSLNKVYGGMLSAMKA